MTPKRFPDRHAIADVRAEAEQLEPGGEAATERRVAGRVMARRDMGKLTFLDLVDRSGRIQLLCPAARTGSVDVDLGDIVGAQGSPRRDCAGEPVAPTTSPRWHSKGSQISWIRPERSTRSRKTSFPMSRRAITRPASRLVSAPSTPGSSASASSRTRAISSRSGNRFGVASLTESGP